MQKIDVSRLKLISTCSNDSKREEDLIRIENIQCTLFPSPCTVPLLCSWILRSKKKVKIVVRILPHFLYYCNSIRFVEAGKIEEVRFLMKFVKHSTRTIFYCRRCQHCDPILREAGSKFTPPIRVLLRSYSRSYWSGSISITLSESCFAYFLQLSAGADASHELAVQIVIPQLILWHMFFAAELMWYVLLLKLLVNRMYIAGLILS